VKPSGFHELHAPFSAVLPVFGAVIGDDLHLGQRILIAKEDIRAADVGVVVGWSIQLEVVVAIA
jgi:hypothetical protein